MKLNIKRLILCIAIPILLGGLSALLTRGSMQTYGAMEKPPLSPPGWLFPIVWTILYATMGFASYLVLHTDKNVTERNRALVLYGVQLLVNVIWPIIFFGKENYTLAFVWICLLWILVLLTVIAFRRQSKLAGLLLVPYLVWITFAAYLNLGVAILNS